MVAITIRIYEYTTRTLGIFDGYWCSSNARKDLNFTKGASMLKLTRFGIFIYFFLAIKRVLPLYVVFVLGLFPTPSIGTVEPRVC